MVTKGEKTSAGFKSSLRSLVFLFQNSLPGSPVPRALLSASRSREQRKDDNNIGLSVPFFVSTHRPGWSGLSLEAIRVWVQEPAHRERGRFWRFRDDWAGAGAAPPTLRRLGDRQDPGLCRRRSRYESRRVLEILFWDLLLACTEQTHQSPEQCVVTQRRTEWQAGGGSGVQDGDSLPCLISCDEVTACGSAGPPMFASPPLTTLPRPYFILLFM